MSRDLAPVLTVLRVCRGWTRTELAKAAGVPNSSLSQYERGQKTPELRTLSRLVEAMGFPLAAVDQTRDFLMELRARRRNVSEVDLEGGGAPTLLRGNERAVGEVDRIAAEVGAAVAQLSRAIFRLVDQVERQTAK